MKRPSNELFELIKSLDRSEKRYFKLYASLHRDNSKFLKLFEAVDKQKEYDEKKIVKKLKDDVPVKNFRFIKRYLYEFILQVMAAYNAGKSISARLNAYLLEIEFLYGKKLYKQCSKIMLRAKKVAMEHNSYFHQLEVLKWERKLLRIKSNLQSQSLQKIDQEEKLTMERMLNSINME